MGKVSVIVPSRNEQFLVKTVADLLAKARGDIEIIVILEGYWEHALPKDPRVRILHHGAPLGMRPSINAATAMATGDYFLKCDAHTMWAEGYDLQLQADLLEDNWVLVPRRYALEPEQWAFDTSNKKYPIDYHFLSEPFERHGDSTPGLHGTAWTERRDARRQIEIDDEMTSQGSAWFLSRSQWQRLGPQDMTTYGIFWHEFQELGLKTWLSGGAVKVTKRTWYAHLYKGSRYGRGYSTRDMGHEDGTAFCSWFWMTDQPFPGRTRSMRWLLERFAPVPTWPSDLDAVFRRAHETLTNPYTRAPIAVAVPDPLTPAAAEGVAMKFRVLSARYGIGSKAGESVDVTEAVRKLATKNGLSMRRVGNDLTGEPVFPGRRKRLVVDYEFDGVAGTATALERKSLTLPA